MYTEPEDMAEELREYAEAEDMAEELRELVTVDADVEAEDMPEEQIEMVTVAARSRCSLQRRQRIRAKYSYQYRTDLMKLHNFSIGLCICVFDQYRE